MIIGFSRPKKWMPLSEIIMWWMGTNYSHVWFCMDLPNIDKKVVFHANWRGVTVEDFDKFSRKNRLVSLIEVGDKQREQDALKFTIENLGKRYGFLALLAIFFGIRFGDGKASMICSELVARAFQLKGDWDYDTVTPQQILLALIKEGKNVISN